MSKELCYALAFSSGLLIAIQAGVNSQLRMAMQHPVLAALISFLTGSVLLAIVYIFSAKSVVPASSITSVGWWKMTGGLLGAIYIFTIIIVAPKIGAANTLCFAIAGQLVSAIILDHFGLIGFPLKEITLSRIAGVILTIVGVYLVQKK
ncbi:membrane protein [Cytophagales bacterium WSM2-2]|nr:membrane protein [Cytophagales bacterium WSM2-2]